MAGTENSSSRKRNRVVSAELQLTQANHHEHQLLMTEQEKQHQPAKKRRKGVAGAILSTALDAALFTSAIGYAAYQLWCGKGLAEEEEQEENSLLAQSPKSILNKPSSSSPPTHTPAVHQILSSPPPPPYEPRQAEQAPLLPPHRRPRLRSTASRLHASSARPTGHSTNPSINFVLQPISEPHSLAADIPTSSTPVRRNSPRRLRRNPTRIDDELMTDFVCSLDPYIPPPFDPSSIEQSIDQDDEEEEEDDPQMKAFKAQIQGLIMQGQAALASRPSSLLIPPTASHSPDPHSLPKSHHHPFNQTHTVDPNLSLLQQAFDNAASKSATNWWEQ